MISLTSQPDIAYFWWQNLVQFCNLESIGQLKHHRAIFLYNKNIGPSKWITEFQREFPTNVFIYENRKASTHYLPQQKLHGFVNYFEEFPHHQRQDIFVFDSDLIFREPIDFSVFKETNTIHGSDTNSYLNYDYIMQKGEPMLEAMCEAGGVSKEVVKENNLNCPGAQLYYKEVPHLLDYFRRAELSCIDLYDAMVNHPTYQEPDVPIQAWTAEMWMVLWEAWIRGTKTKVDKELEFSWATNTLKEWELSKMLHMAGLTEENSKNKFMKSRYLNGFPFHDKHDLNESTITRKYVEVFDEIKKQPKYEKFTHLKQFNTPPL